jgi:hypothetical protein
MITFEGMDRRMPKIEACLHQYGIADLEAARTLCLQHGIDVESIVKGIQPIAFDNAVWAYTIGTAVALAAGTREATEAARKIGEGLQAFTVPGSVAETREVGTGHGNLAAMLLDEDTRCFCLLAGHESFAAAEGGIGIVRSANKVRKNPLRVILNGLGKDSGYTLARFNGFTYMETTFDHATQTLKVLGEKAFSHGERANVKVYCNSSVEEAIEVMKLEHVDVSITGNSANAIRFQHLVAGSYKKWCVAHGVKYFSVASGGGTGRTLHPDNIGAGPISFGITDSIGRTHCDVQFAGSSSVPAHVEMMGLMGMGNNPMVGASVACAVAVSQALAQ